MIELRLLEPGDAAVFSPVADGVFDDAVDRRLTAEFLATEETNVAARGLYESAGAAPEPFVLYAFPLREPGTAQGE